MTAGGAGKARGGGLTPLAGALEAYLDDSGLSEPLARLGALDRWAEAVGPAVAGVSQAVAVRGDALVVEVETSEWINELSMMAPLILERLNAFWNGPPVRAVRFRLRGSPEPAGGVQRRRARWPRRRPEPSSEALPDAETKLKST